MAEKFNNWGVNRGSSGWGDWDLMIEVLEKGLEAYVERCLARPAYAKALARDAEFTA